MWVKMDSNGISATNLFMFDIYVRSLKCPNIIQQVFKSIKKTPDNIDLTNTDNLIKMHFKRPCLKKK